MKPIIISCATPNLLCAISLYLSGVFCPRQSLLIYSSLKFSFLRIPLQTKICPSPSCIIQQHHSLSPSKLFPFHLPSITPFTNLSCLNICPTHLSFLDLIAATNPWHSPILIKTASSLILFVRLIFSVLLIIHIANTSILFHSPFLLAHIFEPYMHTLQTKTLY